VEDLEHPEDQPLGDEWDAVIRDESLLRELGILHELGRFGGEIGHTDDASFQCGAASVTLSER